MIFAAGIEPGSRDLLRARRALPTQLIELRWHRGNFRWHSYKSEIRVAI